MSDFAVKIEALSKNYDFVKAVDNISFAINEGDIFGLIGPDGAGKTTIMRILCGLLSYDIGTCHIFGYDVKNNIEPIHNLIGYMPQRFSLYPDLTVAENLRFFADLFQVEKKEREQRLNRLLSFSRLGLHQKRRAQNLSGGMKQKLALSCSLIHTPKMLILDEPTTGVDPVSRREFWKILQELQKDGVTILVSTPYMDEASLCDQVAFMHKGNFMATDKPGNFAHYLSHQLLEIENDNLYSTYKQLKNCPSVLTSQLFGDKLHITINNEADFEADLKREKINLKSFQKVEPSIEDVFIELMSKKDKDEKNFSSSH
jgi:ABC-2 type transport system ATP-binding protein